MQFLTLQKFILAKLAYYVSYYIYKWWLFYNLLILYPLIESGNVELQLITK